jgi:hypothetical protein
MVNFPDLPFERYADDAVIHCVSKDQTEKLLESLENRLTEVGLQLHRQDTSAKIKTESSTMSIRVLRFLVSFRADQRKGETVKRLRRFYRPSVSKRLTR